jgi:N-acetylneuraminic acid mutarotase
VVDGKIYLIAYLTTTLLVGNEVVNYTEQTVNYQYDPSIDNWTAKARVPTVRSGAEVAVVQNKIYVIGGYTGGVVGSPTPVEVYDPETDTWEQKSQIPWHAYTFNLQANVVDDKIYWIGGITPTPFVIDPQTINAVYNPANDSWNYMKRIPTAIWGYASAVVDDKIYLIGGMNVVASQNVVYDLVQIFDPKTNQWSQVAHLPVGAMHAAACATTGQSAPRRIYVVGGEVPDPSDSSIRTPTNAVQVYDPEMDSWSVGTPLPTASSGLVLANVNDIFYAITGGNSYDSIANEKYVPIGYGTLSSPSPSASSTSMHIFVWSDAYPILTAAVIIVAVATAALVLLREQRNRPIEKQEAQFLFL